MCERERIKYFPVDWCDADLCVSLRNLRLFSSLVVTIKNSRVGVREWIQELRVVTEHVWMDSTMEVAAAFTDPAETPALEGKET